MLSINTNVGQFSAVRALQVADGGVRQLQNRISTGQTVACAKDDGATYAIAQNMRGALAARDALAQSRDRAISLLDTATSGLQSISDLLIQLKKIAVEASDASMDSTARAALDTEFQDLKAQIGTVTSNASFMGENLIDGTPQCRYKLGTSAASLFGFDAMEWAGGGIPPAGADLTFHLGMQLSGTSNIDNADFGVEYGIRAYDGTNWTTQSLGQCSVNARPMLFPYVGFILDSDPGTITMPDVSAAKEVQIFAACRAVLHPAAGESGGPIYYSDNANADPDTSGALAGNPQVIASWSQGDAAVQFHLGDRTLSTTTSVKTLDGVDASSTNLRNYNTPLASLDALQLQNVALTGCDAAATAAEFVDAAQGLVQSAMTHYAGITKTFETLQQSETAISDTMKAAVGRLTDADMATAAAQMTAAQTKQQIAVQALSIANQAPNLLLSLFR